MLSKKVKIIIFGGAVLFLFAILFFVLKNKNASNNKNINIQIENNLNKNKTEEEKFSKDLQELKSNHPEFSIAQLESFEEISKINSNQEIIKQCQERDDKNDCIISAAFIKNDIALCHSHPNSPEEHLEEPDSLGAPHFFLDEKSGKECANALLKKNVQKNIEQCMLLLGDNFFNCLRNIFVIYKEKQECADLPDKETQTICEEIFDYEKAYLEYNRDLCNNIKNEKLNQYCLKTIIDKSQDTDGDGLTDLDEINKYKTHHLFPDTDGDGYSDGEEVKNGFNPRGEGKMP